MVGQLRRKGEPRVDLSGVVSQTFLAGNVERVDVGCLKPGDGSDRMIR